VCDQTEPASGAADDPTHPDVDAQAAAQPRLPPRWETMTTYRKPWTRHHHHHHHHHA
jgi:hypothetical protein